MTNSQALKYNEDSLIFIFLIYNGPSYEDGIQYFQSLNLYKM